MKNWKLLLLLFGLLSGGITLAHDDPDDPVVLTIDGKGIHASEFLYIYLKNNNDPPKKRFKKKKLDAYMELFINYKLKVIAAEELGYDTVPKLTNELATYRRQLAMPYMIDKEQAEKLIEEAYYRTKNEIRASHILIRIPPNASPEDTLQAWNQIMKLRERIVGGEDFNEVAAGKGGSQDPSVRCNSGDLGYFSAMQMVYPFEEAAFTTKMGEVSMPVKTKFGYHLVKPTDLRPAKGKIKVAHIMVMFSQTATPEELEAAEKKINEIYEQLENGEDFADLARKYSDDQTSKTKGGVLPDFGAGAKGRMVIEFEEASYALSENGKYSKPFKTCFGYHIVKRIELTEVPAYEKMYRELKLKVEKDMRAQKTRNSFINKLKAEYKYDDSPSHKLLSNFYQGVTNDIFTGRWKGLPSDAHDDRILISFKDLFYTVADFESYLLSFQNAGKPMPINDFVDEQFAIWSTQKLMDYEDTQLERKYPDFRNLIREYREGILIFEIMQNEIWNKASEDTTGIKNYWESHREDFTYPTRYIKESCTNAKTKQQLKKCMI